MIPFQRCLWRRGWCLRVPSPRAPPPAAWQHWPGRMPREVASSAYSLALAVLRAPALTLNPANSSSLTTRMPSLPVEPATNTCITEVGSDYCKQAMRMHPSAFYTRSCYLLKLIFVLKVSNRRPTVLGSLRLMRVVWVPSCCRNPIGEAWSLCSRCVPPTAGLSRRLPPVDFSGAGCPTFSR